jgi:hypothetical protein
VMTLFEVLCVLALALGYLYWGRTPEYSER